MNAAEDLKTNHVHLFPALKTRPIRFLPTQHLIHDHSKFPTYLLYGGFQHWCNSPIPRVRRTSDYVITFKTTL